MNHKPPCRLCQKVRGTVNRVLGRQTLAERTEEARDASAQRHPLPQRARVPDVSMAIKTTAGTVVVRGPKDAVDIVASIMHRVYRPTL